MFRLLWLLASRRSRGRAALTVLGIALGVALGYGVHLVNRAAVSDLAASVRELAGQADLEVRGGRSGFPESLYPQVAHVEGVAWAKPGLELDVGQRVAAPKTERLLCSLSARLRRKNMFRSPGFRRAIQQTRKNHTLRVTKMSD